MDVLPLGLPKSRNRDSEKLGGQQNDVFTNLDFSDVSLWDQYRFSAETELEMLGGVGLGLQMAWKVDTKATKNVKLRDGGDALCANFLSLAFP